MKISRKWIGVFIAFSLLGGSLNAATLQCLNQKNTNLVPLRTISEELGAKVNYDKVKQVITVTYKDTLIEAKIGSRIATVNGKQTELQVAPQIVEGVTYVPIRFVGEALGGNVSYQSGVLKIELDQVAKEWQLQSIGQTTSVATGKTFTSGTKTVKGKKVTYVMIDMNDPKVKVKIATAQNKVTSASPLKTLAAGAKASVNGTYFAAYNGDIPLPDGTLVVNGKTIHITDIGSTIGFTADNKVIIDFVKTRVQGYINGQESFVSYRVNRPTPDSSATILYTPEYGKSIPLESGWSAVVCINGKVEKIVTQSRTVPDNGFILVTKKPEKFKVGDTVSYKTTYSPTQTTSSEWENVVYALSAGPSLMINGKKTGDPAKESFTEAKILTNTAQRSFIGITADNQLMIGTVSSNIATLKDIVKELGLKSAMCLDGGASSGIYYDGSYLCTPGRELSNSINFSYSKN